jgi:hypothetical protein
LLAARFQGGEVAIQAAGNCIYIPLDNFSKIRQDNRDQDSFAEELKNKSIISLPGFSTWRKSGHYRVQALAF